MCQSVIDLRNKIGQVHGEKNHSPHSLDRNPARLMHNTRDDDFALLVTAPQAVTPRLVLSKPLCHEILPVSWVNRATTHLQVSVPEAVQKLQAAVAWVGAAFSLAPDASDFRVMFLNASTEVSCPFTVMGYVTPCPADAGSSPVLPGDTRAFCWPTAVRTSLTESP